MYALCTLVVVSLQSLLRTWRRTLESGAQRESSRPGDWGVFEGPESVLDRLTQAQPAHRLGTLLSPAVMLGTRKTWDLGHAPSLPEFWSDEIALDVSTVELLMSGSEEESSFVQQQSALHPNHLVTSDLSNHNAKVDQQLILQTLQEKVCVFQTHLCAEETNGKRQQLHIPPGTEQQALVGHLQTQVKELEQKLLDRSQEVERLRSELGATDLEKHLEILVSENQRLKQELSVCQDSLSASACQACQHSQDAENQRNELAMLEARLQEKGSRVSELEARLQEKGSRVSELEARLQEKGSRVSELEARLQEKGSRVSELEARLQEKGSRVSELEARLQEKGSRVSELERQLEESFQDREETELQLGRQLKDCQLTLSRQLALPPQVKYVTRTVEVESARSQHALLEAQAQSQALQEQVSVQRELLHELQEQLHESQRAVSQLRAQVLVYEAEMERAQGQLEAEMQNLEEEKNRIIEEAFVRAEGEMKAVHDNLAGVRLNLLTLQPALRTLTCDYNCLKKQVQDFPLMLEKAITEAKQEISQVIDQVSDANEELLRKYKREMNLRKKCHDELVRLKGNIRVFCRVRPICKSELVSPEARNIVTFDPNDDAVLSLSNKGKLMTFELDKVFQPQATQEEVFQEVQSLITSCIDGYNVCIFAYGQTGSGKTYTMEGVPEHPGINQRALQLLFSEVSEKTPDWDFNITVSMVEIYNETLRNLLADNPSEKLDIKMCPDGSGHLYVPGLTAVTVQSVKDINRVFDLGHMNRATACTNLNEHSSRSHALLIITVAGFNSSTGQRTTGKLNLVDLAGSERIARSGAEGSRLREAQCINKSLSALGDVIHALRARQPHVPFRNSRLTYLLQDSLSGDSKTLMMVQVSPMEGNVSESVCSLMFGQRVRTVELGSARKQVDSSSASSSPTRDSGELDSPPVTPMHPPVSRVSSAGSNRRKLQTQQNSGKMKLAA